MTIDTMAPTSIRLVACAKTFEDGTVAVSPIDVEITAGETVVILGPSGCGKTTTLRMIAGLETPDDGGRVYFGDEDVTSIPIERRNVGMVFQSYALFPNLDVLGNIAYGLRLRGVPVKEREQRARELMTMMQLNAFEHRSIDQLSGGQKQRVALARALAVAPRILLLDEPLTALDAKLRETLRFEINSLLRKLHITTVYVTHDQAEAMSLGDRIVVMDHGRIAQIGTPREIYSRPSTRYVGDFVGTMNRISGKLRDGIFVCDAGSMACPGLSGPINEIMFRPEAVSIVDEQRGNFACKIRSVAYLGSCTRLLVDGFGAHSIVIESSDDREFVVGERIHVSIRPTAVMSFEGS